MRLPMEGQNSEFKTSWLQKILFSEELLTDN